MESRKPNFGPQMKIAMTVAAIAASTLTGSQTARADGAASELSLSDILDLQIVTASKKPESLFDSPLSSSVITREDIKNAGCTTIVDALHLVPGFLIRQTTNGNFDVTARGMDGMPPANFWAATSNSITLVMIDNRVVYNYFQGGTFWETLPIGLDDVERIEIVRGPASALYGPNAVSGLVNIFTRRPQREGISTWGSAEGGSATTTRAGASVSYLVKDKWNVTANVNFDRRERFQNTYFSHISQSYTAVDAMPGRKDSKTGAFVGTAQAAPGAAYRWYPEPSLALRNFGTNLFANYKLDEKTSFDLEGGYQTSRNQTVQMDNLATPLTTRDSTTGYVDFKANYGELSFHGAMNTGNQNYPGLGGYNLLSPTAIIAAGCNLVRLGTTPLGYSCPSGSDIKLLDLTSPIYNYFANLTTIDADLAYDWYLGDFRIRPGASARYANFDSLFLGGSQIINDVGVSLQTEYNANNTRVVAAIRGDKYSRPEQPYFSWELVAMRKLGDSQVLRGVYSHANKSPAMSELFLKLTQPGSAYIGSGSDAITFMCARAGQALGLSGTALTSFIATTCGAAIATSMTGAGFVTYTGAYSGDLNVKLLQQDTWELGHRIKIGSNINVDHDFFYSVVDAFPGLYNTGSSAPNFVTQSNFGARQFGVTSSTTYVPSINLQTRLYFTTQVTMITDGKSGNDVSKALQTPLLYGGLVMNYKPIPKLNVNLNPYFVTDSIVNTADNVLYTAGIPLKPVVNPPATVPMHLLVNAKATYEVMPNVYAFVNARNALNYTSPDFPWVDNNAGLYTAGVHAEF